MSQIYSFTLFRMNNIYLSKAKKLKVTNLIFLFSMFTLFCSFFNYLCFYVSNS